VTRTTPGEVSQGKIRMNELVDSLFSTLSETILEFFNQIIAMLFGGNLG
jgi:hypothetical protein